jgi:hypothetical protein
VLYRRGVTVVSLAIGALLAASLAAGVSARTQSKTTATNSCAIGQPKSLDDNVKASITFVNKTTGDVRVVWLDYTGKRVPYATVKPGESLDQSTFEANAWIVLDSAGTCIGYVVAGNPSQVYTVEPTQQAAQAGSTEGAQAAGQVNVTVGGPGTVEGSGITCGGSQDVCSLYNLTLGKPVTLHAVPAPGAVFVGWSPGTCDQTSSNCTPVFECAAVHSPTCTVTPTFVRRLDWGTAEVSATFKLSSPPTGNQSFGLSVRFLYAGGGYPTLARWSAPAALVKACIGKGAIGPIGSPAGSVHVDCHISVPSGTAVSLYSAPGVVQLWQGACVGTADACQLIVDGPTEVDYVPNPNVSQGEGFAVTVKVTPGGTVTGPGIACTGPNVAGCKNSNMEALNLTATAAPGYHFAGWSGACSRFRTSAKCTVGSISKAQSGRVTATFARG